MSILNADDVYNRSFNYPAYRFLYRLNPLAKLAAVLPGMLGLIFVRNLETPITFVLLTLGLLLVGAQLNWRIWLMMLIGLPSVALLLSVSFGIWTNQSLVSDTPVVFEIIGIKLYQGGWLVGAATATRLAAIVMLTMLSGLTTTGPDLIRSLVQQLKVPYRIGYTALAAYRFVPRFAYELELIRSAHRVRGRTGGKGPFAGIRRTTGYLVPLLASAIRHAERVALAMDSRAFGAAPNRTERYIMHWRIWDSVFVIGFWMIIAAAFVLTLR